MSIHVLYCEHPHRSIALVTQSYALVFRQSASNPQSHVDVVVSRNNLKKSGTTHCIVEFVTRASIDLNNYYPLNPLPVYGTLGLITINTDIFICVVTSAVKVASVRPGETVEKINGVEFYCLNTSDYNSINREVLESHSSNDGYYSTNTKLKETLLEQPCVELQKLISDGSFYFSTDFDLTNRLQDRHGEKNSLDIDNMDSSFLWNSYMISPLVKFRSHLLGHEKKALDLSRVLTLAIRGFVLSIKIPTCSVSLRKAEVDGPTSLILISRLSCKRAGTRFNSRGIDDDGNVANFVESETICWIPLAPKKGDSPRTTRAAKPFGVCFSYVQIRGSVPIFWEQATGMLPGQQKISITRSSEASQPSFGKHFDELEQKYGSIHIINLLSETKSSESELTRCYRHAVKEARNKRFGARNVRDSQYIKETEFDFHAETKGPSGYQAASMICRLIENSANSYAYYLSEDEVAENDNSQETQNDQPVIVLQQQGVFRTNCLDCLDRTNLIQTIISQMVLKAFLAYRCEKAAPEVWKQHSILWADNGDALSHIYAGTGALKSSFTRYGKMRIAGAFDDARKSATRLYINNFTDKGRQNTVDLLLGRSIGQTSIHIFDPINDHVVSELSKRAPKYQSSETIKIWCGTFNLNGRTLGTDDDLKPWLYPGSDLTQQCPEILAVGFQEIVELSPQQIMSTDPARKEAWERIVLTTLNAQAQIANSEHYVLLRSGQLVGASLMIFVKKSVLAKFRNVEGSVKMTGMSGMAGNKGAVAIRMDYADTSFCFVTAHLASGFSNYEERNSDFATIHYGLRFQRNRVINDHDVIIWMGDFNYRIGLGIETVKQLIKRGDLDTLYQNDQLNLQMIAGEVFPYYTESKITFTPTYKFDRGKDTYDTSEKARIPAWTDRILLKGTNIRQINYNTAPIRFSDHRPVYATFLCTVINIDEAQREILSRQIYEKRKARINGNNLIDAQENELDLGKDMDDQVISAKIGLPPASSAQQKWWLDNNSNARSSIQPPQKDMIPNSNMPSNPYTSTNEPDWIKVSRDTKSTVSKLHPKISSPPTPQVSLASINTQARDLPQNSQNELAVVKLRNKALLLPSQSNSIKNSTKNSSGAVVDNRARPPIARKPVHLTSSPVLPTANASTTTASTTTTNFNAPKPVSNTVNLKIKDPHETESVKKMVEPPLPPRSRRTVESSSPIYKEKVIINDDKIKPSVSVTEQSSIDLLGSDIDAGFGSWQVLKPQ